MHFLRVNVTFYDAVNVIHNVITTANPSPYTAKFNFVGVRNNKNSTKQTLIYGNTIYVFSISVIHTLLEQKYTLKS